MAGATLALKITGDARDGIRALDDVEERAGRTGGVLGKIGSGMAVGLAAGAAGIIGLGAGLAGLYGAADESRKITALTEQVIKSTGGAAQVTADQVGELAGSIAAKTGVDDEAIQSGANLLLTFTNLKNGVGAGNDIFDQATSIMTDMSVALGTDASGSAVQLGKALNDPIAGVSALTKVGVSFTDQQKDQIKTLVESGDTMGAQKIILAELSKEFGGAAEAAATPLGLLQQKVGDVAETFGGYLLPVVDTAASFITEKAIPLFQQWTAEGGPLREAFDKIGAVVQDRVLPVLGQLWDYAQANVLPLLAQLGAFVRDDVVPALGVLWSYISDYVIPIFRTVLTPVIDGARDAFKKIAEKIDENKDKFADFYEQLKPFLAWMRDTLAPFVAGKLVGAFEDATAAIGPTIDAIAWILDNVGKAIDLLNGGGMSVQGGIGKTKGAGRPMGAAPLRGAPAGMFAAATPLSVGGGGGAFSTRPQLVAAGGDTYQITVTGALDPDAVADQIERLLTRRARMTGRAMAAAL